MHGLVDSMPDGWQPALLSAVGAGFVQASQLRQGCQGEAVGGGGARGAGRWSDTCNVDAARLLHHLHSTPGPTSEDCTVSSQAMHLLSAGKVSKVGVARNEKSCRTASIA